MKKGAAIARSAPFLSPQPVVGRNRAYLLKTR